MKINFHIKGTHCQSCKLLIEDVCRDLPEVTACTVNAETGDAELEYTEGLDLGLVKKEIEALGSYTVENLI